jgi:spermidine synthase
MINGILKRAGGLAAGSVLLGVFAVSGFAGLVYEILWIRDFAFVLGNTVQTVSIVLAAYMTGLAAGSWAAGRWAGRITRPLAAYAILEVATGLAGIAVYYSFSLWIRGLGVAASGGEILLPAALGRFALSFVVLFPPTFLMGATLPLLTAHAAKNKERTGTAVGALYGANTLGAAAGCFTTGFFLIRLYGMERSVWIAAGLNLVAGLLALLLEALTREKAREPGAAVPRVKPPRTVATPGGKAAVPARTAFMLFAVFVAGYASLSYEVLYARFLNYFLGNRVYASTTMITAFLVGMALGSAVAGWITDRIKREVLIFSALQAAIGLAAALTARHYADILDMLGYLEAGVAGDDPVGQIRIRLAGAFAVLAVPALASGASFPVAVRFLSRGATASAAVGRAYAFNTAGCIAGSLVTGLALIPAVGSARAMALTAALSVLAAHRLLAADWGAAGPLRRTASVLAAAILAIVAFRTASVGNGSEAAAADAWRAPLATGTGSFSRERPALHQIFSREEPAALITAYTGPMGFYLYADDTELSFPLGSQTAAERVQNLQAHIPILLHRDPKRALVVGMGFGVASSAFARYEGLERVDTVELLKGVITAGRLFGKYNADAFGPKSVLIAGDGRQHLRSTHERYDIVASNVNGTDLPGSAGCYTREYFELVRGKLAPGGIFLLHVFGKDRPSVYKTLAAVFPHVIGFRAYKRTEFLLASLEPLRPDRAQVESRLAGNPVFAADARNKSGIGSWETFLGRQIFGEEEFVKLAANDEPLNTDSNPVLEYRVRTAGGGMFESRLARSVMFFEKTAIVSAVGDILLYHWPAGNVFKAKAGGGGEAVFDYPFGGILRDIRGLVVGNLEGPFTSANPVATANKNGPSYYRQPPEYVRALVRGGVKVVSLANNHMMDCGPEGLRETLAVLKSAGIRAVGAGMDMTEARRPVILEENTVRVAFLAYNLVGPPSARAGARGKPGVSWADGEGICNDVLAVRDRAEAVVVMLHWGTETRKEFNPIPPSAARVKLAHAIINSGASLVLGSHSHALEPVMRYRHGLICYGLGDFVFAGKGQSRQTRSVVVRAGISSDGVGRHHVIPVLIAPVRNNP